MNELARLAALALEKTRAGKLSWRVAPGKNTYVTIFEDVLFQIEYRTFEGASPDYRISIKTKAGDEIESYFQEHNDPDHALLLELHNSARRNALKIDEVLAKIERSLKSL